MRGLGGNAPLAPTGRKSTTSSVRAAHARQKTVNVCRHPVTTPNSPLAMKVKVRNLRSQGPLHRLAGRRFLRRRNHDEYCERGFVFSLWITVRHIQISGSVMMLRLTQYPPFQDRLSHSRGDVYHANEPRHLILPQRV